MIKIIVFLLATLGLGAGLAELGVWVPVPVGWIGAGLLIGWAVVARRRWERLRALDGSDPGAPERGVWQRMAGNAAICGHLMVVLLNPQIDLHFGSGNWLAIDSWTLFLGTWLSALVFRIDRRDRDERDDQIDATATRAGYGALIACLVGLLSYLAYATRPMQTGLTHWVLANLLLELIFVSLLVRQIAQLIGYSRDGR